jgi:hypothetical protein
MGCYDTILLPCPKCGEIYDAQSKSGDCTLRVFDFKDTPQDVMSNVNRHAPFVCFKCHTVFHVVFTPETKIAETDFVEEDFDFLEDLSDCPTKEDIADRFVDYVSKLNKK